MKNRPIVFLLILFLASQCSQKEAIVAPKIATLIGTWQLIDADSSYAVTLTFAYDSANPPHDITPFLANGKAAVNTYTLRLFATLDGVLVADNLASTYVSGPQEAMAFEQAYLTNLKAAVRYDVTKDDHLRVYHAGAQPHVMEYKRIN